MEQKWRYDSMPGRTAEEMEREQLLQRLQEPMEIRFARFMDMIRLGLKIREAQEAKKERE